MRTQIRNPSLARVAGIAALLIATACSSERVIGPGNQLEVVNQPGTFEWQVTALDAVSQTLTYTWANPGTVANVNQASSLGGGSADVRIRDAAGAEVYARSLAENGTFQTSAGASGSWTVVVTLDRASGALNFRLDTP